MTDPAPGIEGFVLLNKQIAEYILHVLTSVDCGRMKIEEGRSRLMTVESEIENHCKEKEERRVLFTPLRALCEEVKNLLIKKMS